MNFKLLSLYLYLSISLSIYMLWMIFGFHNVAVFNHIQVKYSFLSLCFVTGNKFLV